MVALTAEDYIREFFLVLYRAWGRQNWWPAESAFEVVAGAILTQNTAWINVERALANLRGAGRLNLKGIREIPVADLENLVRCAGFFRQKARRLKNFVAHVDDRYDGSLEKLLAQPKGSLRQELLELNGIGPETADSILLYAGQHEVFVVDAYSRRILERHGLVSPSMGYEEVRQLFERSLTSDFADGVLRETADAENRGIVKPAGAYHLPSPMSNQPRSQRAQVFNETHGLIVGVGKKFCRSRRALCEECPLGRFLERPSTAGAVQVKCE